MYTIKYGRKGEVFQRIERWNFLEVAMGRASDIINKEKFFGVYWDWVEVWHDTDLYGGTEVCHAVFTK